MICSASALRTSRWPATIRIPILPRPSPSEARHRKAMPQMISLIAVVARNRAIGSKQQLLWHLPEDLRHFRATTARQAGDHGQKNLGIACRLLFARCRAGSTSSSAATPTTCRAGPHGQRARSSRRFLWPATRRGLHHWRCGALSADPAAGPTPLPHRSRRRRRGMTVSFRKFLPPNGGKFRAVPAMPTRLLLPQRAACPASISCLRAFARKQTTVPKAHSPSPAIAP
jgi:hypothetical protein